MELDKIFRARITLYEMLIGDRKYTHKPEVSNFLITYQEFLNLPDKINISGIYDTNDRPVLIHFTDGKATDLPDETKTKLPNSIYSAVFATAKSKYADDNINWGTDKILESYNIDQITGEKGEGGGHFIVVYNAIKSEGKLYSFIETDSPKLVRRNNFEFFGIQKLQFNVTKHVMQPKFKLLDDDEKKTVYDNFNATVATVKKMCRNDVIAAYYNAKVGDMFEITGNGYAPSYRAVSNRLTPKRNIPKKKE